MSTTDLKFFTNEPERTLYDRFNKINFLFDSGAKNVILYTIAKTRN